jgi:hypothetical protein
MNKKAIEPALWILIEAAVITVAIIIVFSYIRSVQEDTLFMQKYLARDTALMVETMSSVPGDVVYTYQDSKADLSIYSFSFSSGNARVGLGPELTPPDYPYYIDTSLKPNLATVTASKQLVFAKRGTSLDFAAALPLGYQQGCGSIDTKGQINVLVVDPADAKALKTADYMRGKSSIPVTLTTQKVPESEDKRLSAISESTDAVVGMQFTSDGLMRVRYGNANQQQAEKLACLILKNLPTGGTSISSNDRMLLKNTRGIAVKVEVGTTIDEATVANAVLSAVREYNG